MTLAEVHYDGTLFGRVPPDLADLCVANGINAGIRSIRVTIDGVTTEHLTERRTTVRRVAEQVDIDSDDYIGGADEAERAAIMNGDAS